uniref:Mitochondrial ribosomal protein L57 n=1 Tax=Salvator merianae TaxID=96440 RepID=A0A8D0C8Q8_SALMN
MFLTTALLRSRISGGQWIGKYRRPRFITAVMKKGMIRRLEIEAENEYWLSQPYLTKAQEYRHNQERRRNYIKARMMAARANFPEHRYVSEHLSHLNVTKVW